MNHPSTLGILGGAGPRAANKFVEYFLQAWAYRYYAWKDHEYPRLIIDTQAFDGMSAEGPTDNEGLEVSIAEGAARLAEMGANAFVVPCFSAHRVYNKDGFGLPWINLRELAMNRFFGTPKPTIVLEACDKKSFTQQWMNRFPGVMFVAPKEDEIGFIKNTIQLAMAFKSTERPDSGVHLLKGRYYYAAERQVILGCSELSLIDWGPLDVYDCLKESAVGLVDLIKDFK